MAANHQPHHRRFRGVSSASSASESSQDSPIATDEYQRVRHKILSGTRSVQTQRVRQEINLHTAPVPTSSPAPAQPATPPITSTPPVAIHTPAAEVAPQTVLEEHPAQNPTRSDPIHPGGGAPVLEASKIRKGIKTIIYVASGICFVWIAGNTAFNYWGNYPIASSESGQPSNAGFRTNTGHSIGQETESGGRLLADMHQLVNSDHGIRESLLRVVGGAQQTGQEVAASAEAFESQAQQWSSGISRSQDELISIEQHSGAISAIIDTIKFVVIPYSPIPNYKFLSSSSNLPDHEVRQHILHVGRRLLARLKTINSNAQHLHRDVTAWHQKYQQVDQILGQVLGERINLKRALASSFAYLPFFTGKKKREARAEQADRLDEQIEKLRATDDLLCQTSKHLYHVEQGSDSAMSKVEDVEKVLSDLMHDCSSGKACFEFPDQLKISGASDEEVADYLEHTQAECSKDCEDDFELGYVNCVVM